MKKIFMILAIAVLTLSSCGQKKVADETITVTEQATVETVVEAAAETAPADTAVVE